MRRSIRGSLGWNPKGWCPAVVHNVERKVARLDVTLPRQKEQPAKRGDQ